MTDPNRLARWDALHAAGLLTKAELLALNRNRNEALAALARARGTSPPAMQPLECAAVSDVAPQPVAPLSPTPQKTRFRWLGLARGSRPTGKLARRPDSLVEDDRRQPVRPSLA